MNEMNRRELRRPSRFFVPEIPDSGKPSLKLPDDEARHAASALRIQEGEVVELFDGSGRVASARTTSVAKRCVEVSIESVSVEPPPKRSIVVAVAPPKGDRLRWLVEKLTELGVTRMQLLRTRFSVVEPGSSKVQKLRQTSLAAAKQCGRNYLLEIAPPMAWSEFLEERRHHVPLLVAHPSGKRLLDCLSLTGLPEMHVAIGPEGGLTEDEVQEAAEKGGQAVSLGDSILRIETAAIAAASALSLLNSD